MSPLKFSSTDEFLYARRRDSEMALRLSFPAELKDTGIRVEFFQDPAGDFISVVALIKLNRPPTPYIYQAW